MIPILTFLCGILVGWLLGRRPPIVTRIAGQAVSGEALVEPADSRCVASPNAYEVLYRNADGIKVRYIGKNATAARKVFETEEPLLGDVVEFWHVRDRRGTKYHPNDPRAR